MMKPLATLVFAALLITPSLSTADDSLMIVLDGSNSMWGKLHGEHKISLARQRLATLLEQQTAQTNIGLITYGAQHKADCHDIQTIQPAANNSEAIRNAATKITPRGRSPIAQAIQQAAQLSDNLVLISDGQESCDADPCAVAKTLKASKPNLRIHVIALRDTSDDQLHCLADNTGGNFILASDTNTLPTIISAAPSNKTPPVNATADSPGTLQLSLGADNAQETLPANFLIYDHNKQLVASFSDKSQVTHRLPAGTYQVDALWGEIKQTHSVEITAGNTTPYHFNLGAMGTLSLQAVNTQQQTVAANFTIYDAQDDYITSQLLKNSSREKLLVGTYRVKASVGEQTQTATLEIKANAETSHTFTFQTAP